MASAGWAQEISPRPGLSGPADPVTAPAGPGTGTAGGPALLDWIGLGVALLAPVSLVLLWKGRVIGPRALSTPRARQTGLHAWWAWALSPLAIYLAMSIGAILAATTMFSNDELKRTAALMLGAGAAGIGAAIALSEVVRRPPRWAARRAADPDACAGCGYPMAGLALDAACPECGKTERNGPAPAHAVEGLDLRPRWRDVRTGLLGLAAAYPLVQASSMAAVIVWTLLTGAAPRELAHDTLRQIKDHFHDPAVWGIVIGAVVLAPIAEELTFRVFVQSAALKATGRPWAAVLIASLIFAMVHLGGGVEPEDAHALVPLFVFGLALGTAYEKTRRVWVTITMHMAFNAVNVGMALAA
jgi:membrane protease YdiL (CAAX protease family)